LLKELETDLNPESTNLSNNKLQKHPRYQVYTVILDDLIENPIFLGLYLVVFGIVIQNKPRLYKNNIPITLDGWIEINTKVQIYQGIYKSS
jgi:hypothetical protein